MNFEHDPFFLVEFLIRMRFFFVDFLKINLLKGSIKNKNFATNSSTPKFEQDRQFNLPNQPQQQQRYVPKSTTEMIINNPLIPPKITPNNQFNNASFFSLFFTLYKALDSPNSR